MLTTTVPASPSALADGSTAHVVHGPILLATDGHAPTDATAMAARTVADRLAQRVEALAVLPPLPVYDGGYGLPTLPADFETQRRAEVQAVVSRRLVPVLGRRERWDLQLRYGDPARVIADTAREREAGLIVVGTGSHGFADRLLGEEISLQVVRHASAPVLAVAPQQVGPFSRAVVGIDFSAASVRAAQTALALLEPNPDRTGLLESGYDGPGLLTLVHVQAAAEHIPPGLATWNREYVAHVAAMFDGLRDLLRPYVPAGVTVETRVRTGEVVACLQEVARETGAALIAVGTHGPGWVERLFVGSIATDALRQLDRTVLIAPPPRIAERVRLELRIAGQVTLDRAEDWPGALDVFTHRNLGRRVRLEVSGPDIPGLMEQASGYRFRGASYDPHDRRLEIMLEGDGGRARHLTHGIAHVRSLDIIADGATRDRALLVDVPGGEAVLTFTP